MEVVLEIYEQFYTTSYVHHRDTGSLRYTEYSNRRDLFCKVFIDNKEFVVIYEHEGSRQKLLNKFTLIYEEGQFILSEEEKTKFKDLFKFDDLSIPLISKIIREKLKKEKTEKERIIYNNNYKEKAKKLLKDNNMSLKELLKIVKE